MSSGVHLVTGNLGGGKSLMTVFRIKDYLARGCKVATNLDIFLHHMFPREKKDICLYRLPDKPKLEDFELLGYAHHSYDESKNGLIVLDECGTWFNSRNFMDKARQPMIDWLLHARKFGWDVIFIVQNASLIDKQARLALGEHVVYCRRTDRLNLPLIGFLFKILWGGRLPLPKVHIGVVKYGLQPNAMTVDTWTCVGTSLYLAYDTKQVFSDSYRHGVFSVLPPWWTHGRFAVQKDKVFYMRLTKIYLKKYSRVSIFFAGIIVCFLLMTILGSRKIHASLPSVAKSSRPKPSPSGSAPAPSSDAPKPAEKVAKAKPVNDPLVPYSLDYIQVGSRMILHFDGQRYSPFNFPYKLSQEGSVIYAEIPASLAAKLARRKPEAAPSSDTAAAAVAAAQ